MRSCSTIAAGMILSVSTAAAWATDMPPASDAGYQDRLIQGAGQAPSESEEDLGTTDVSGLPRALKVEAGVADTQYGTTSQREAGLNVSAFWDTLSWGSWSLDAMLRSGDANYGGNGSSFTLWQRRMPFADGWYADNGLGVVNAPMLPLMRSGYRFVLPTTVIDGAETDWSHSGGLEIQAAAGEPGFFEGGHWSAYQATGGELAQAGSQWSWSPQLSSAIAVIGEHNVLPWWAISTLGTQPTSQLPTPRIDAQSLYAATAWQGDVTQIQANLLAGNSTGTGTQTGLWVDAETDADYYRQHYGLFRMGTDLSWGALPFTNDIEGGYYRLDYQRAQWSWSAGLDQVHSLSADGVDGSYLNGSLRYQARPWLAIGGDATVNPNAGGAYSASLFVDLNTRWGGSRFQLQQAQDEQNKQSRQLSWDQSLPTRENLHLSLAVSIASVDSVDGGTTRSESLAAYGGYQLGEALTLDGNVRWTRGQGPEGEHGFDGNVNLNWRFSQSWSVAATYYQSQATQRSVFVIDPIAQSTPFIALPRTWAYSLMLRYERRAGSPPSVLGGVAGAGAGSITGSVFLDKNGNGRREAGEQGAPNVTIVLDGRYSLRTDASGRFDFSMVGAGEHTIAVIPDNLPLPWMLDEHAANIRVVVKPRDGVQLDIAAKQSL